MLRELNANEVEFYYAPDLNRNVAIYRDLTLTPPSNTVKTHFYGTGYEKTVDFATNDDEELCYVSAGGELIAIFRHSSSTAGSANPPEIYYVVTDHLGSITHIMDNVGTSFSDGLVEERSYDAWGRPPATQAIYSPTLRVRCSPGLPTGAIPSRSITGLQVYTIPALST